MSGEEPVVHSVPTITHGRVLVRRARAAAARGVLVGFHGYGESAGAQMKRLEAAAPAAWTLVSIQALHRFYDRRTQQVVACWMTHEDRENAIADNLAYVTTALDEVPESDSLPLVFAGFSQGAAMAYRGACRGARPAAGVISVGGDVPPELLADSTISFPRVLMIRGRHDEWYSQQKFDDDRAALTARGVDLEALIVEGGHEWGEPVNVLAGGLLAQASARRRSSRIEKRSNEANGENGKDV